MRRRAAYYILRYLYYLARRVAACGFRRLIYRMVLFDHAMRDILAERKGDALLAHLIALARFEAIWQAQH